MNRPPSGSGSSTSVVAPRYSQLLLMVSLAMTVAQTLSIPVLIRGIVSSQDTGSCSVMKSKGGVPEEPLPPLSLVQPA